MTDRFAARRKRLLSRLKKTDAEALLVTNFTNVRYLTGFTGGDSYLLLGPDVTLLLSDGRFTTQIEEECPDLDAHIRKPGQPMKQAVGRVVKKSKLRHVGFESHSLTCEQWQSFQNQAERAEWQPLSGLVEELRQKKDAGEITAIREAVRQAERGFGVLRASLVDSLSEREAAHELEHAMRRFGAERAAFEPIVASGPRSALPHARPGKAGVTEKGCVLIDWGAVEPGGYRSDLTRLLAAGNIPPKVEKIHGVVFNAQRRALDAIRPGANARDVDAAARAEIDKAGYGKYFGHGLGHGIGLDIHEGPRLSPTSEAVLRAGMIVTVEPGIYLPGRGGVRIEDDVLVTRDGCEVLTSVPRELAQSLIQ